MAIGIAIFLRFLFKHRGDYMKTLRLVLESLLVGGMLLGIIFFYTSSSAFDDNGMPQNQQEIKQITNRDDVREARGVHNFNRETNSFDLTESR